MLFLIKKKILWDANPEIADRNWYLLSISYNRILINKPKFQLLTGGGFQYREGFETYQLFNILPSTYTFNENFWAWKIKKNDIAATININLKYKFWKKLFLYSKIDLQYYFYDAAKGTYDELVEKNSNWVFPRTKPINHTLSIGLGWEF